MNDKTRLLNDWMHLAAHQRKDFQSEICRDQQSGASKQRQLGETTETHVNEMQTGPMGSACARSGR